MTQVTRESWLARHPYLQPVAGVRALIEAAAGRVPGSVTGEPDWQNYLPDFHAGTPLLESERSAVSVSDPEIVVSSMLDVLLSMVLPPAFADKCRALLGSDGGQTGVRPGSDAGLFRCLLWTVVARDLGPIVLAFARWRDDERWLRNYCPTCGEAPAMGQLVGKDPGRLRLLSCGCCGTRWRYRRTGCPFCERTDDHRLAVVGVEGESGLRIDYCDRCRGYLKTYDGEGSESVLLADWTSLHLDLLARDRGLKRMAASLYEV